MKIKIVGNQIFAKKIFNNWKLWTHTETQSSCTYYSLIITLIYSSSSPKPQLGKIKESLTHTKELQESNIRKTCLTLQDIHSSCLQHVLLKVWIKTLISTSKRWNHTISVLRAPRNPSDSKTRVKKMHKIEEHQYDPLGHISSTRK